jgi:hypothetical protein
MAVSAVPSSLEAFGAALANAMLANAPVITKKRIARGWQPQTRTRRRKSVALEEATCRHDGTGSSGSGCSSRTREPGQFKACTERRPWNYGTAKVSNHPNWLVGGPTMSARTLVTLAALVASLATAPGRAQPAAPVSPGGASVQAAVWTPKQLEFQYVGFTTKYTCDGLLKKMKDVLTMLGARQLQVRSAGCIGTPAPETVTGVYIKMNVLQPAAGVAKAEPVPALWQSVDLLARRDPVDAAADCELIEQIKLKILPLFTTRNVEYSSACAAHHLTVGGTKLKADVLMPEYAPAAATR